MKAKDTGAIVWGGLLAAVAVGAVWLGFALLPDRPAGPVLSGQMRTFDTAPTPEAAPDISFSDALGNSLGLDDFRGHVVLVNLWATWCAPCRAEMPALDALQVAEGGEDFEVVAVNVDAGDDAKPKAFLAEIGVENLAFYRDETIELFNTLKRRNLALGLPVTLLVDERGCLLAHMNGPAEWASEDARRLIRAATGG